MLQFSTQWKSVKELRIKRSLVKSEDIMKNMGLCLYMSVRHLKGIYSGDPKTGHVRFFECSVFQMVQKQDDRQTISLDHLKYILKQLFL